MNAFAVGVPPFVTAVSRFTTAMSALRNVGAIGESACVASPASRCSSGPSKCTSPPKARTTGSPRVVEPLCAGASNRRSPRGRRRKRAARRADSSGHDSHVRFAPTTSSSWSRLGRGAQGDRAAGRDRRRDRHCRDARGRPLPVAADVGERGVRPDPGHLLVRDHHVDRDLLAGRRGRRLLGVEVARSAGRRRGGPADPRPHGTRDRLDGRACDPRDRARASSARSCSPRTGRRATTSSTFA